MPWASAHPQAAPHQKVCLSLQLPSSPRVSQVEALPNLQPGSVKHLTCYYWHTNGKCKKSNKGCLYSHFHTGILADQPLQLEPGRMVIPSTQLVDLALLTNEIGPAVAGLNLLAQTHVHGEWRKGRTQSTFCGSPSSYGTPCKSGTRDSAITIGCSGSSGSCKSSAGSAATTANDAALRVYLVLRDAIRHYNILANKSQKCLVDVDCTLKRSHFMLVSSVNNVHATSDSIQSCINRLAIIVLECVAVEDELQETKLNLLRLEESFIKRLGPLGLQYENLIKESEKAHIVG